MSGSIAGTPPYGRDAIAAWVPGGIAGLLPRIPDGHRLHVDAPSRKGPWRVELFQRNGTCVYDRTVSSAAFPEAVETALTQVWP